MQARLRVELHALERRFAALRVRNPRRLAALVRSMEHSGQLTPVVVAPLRLLYASLLCYGQSPVASTALPQLWFWQTSSHCLAHDPHSFG
jgi:hypothetical protein